MKISQIALLLAIVSFPLSAEETQFKSIQEDYKAKAAVVEQLNEIVLTKVKIDKMTLGGAMVKLQKNGSPVINYVIRKPQVVGAVISDDDPFAGNDDPFGGKPTPKKQPPKRLTLVSESISFAKAVDIACQKAGYRWAIDFDEQKNPLLILTPN